MTTVILVIVGMVRAARAGVANCARSRSRRLGRQLGARQLGLHMVGTRPSAKARIVTFVIGSYASATLGRDTATGRVRIGNAVIRGSCVFALGGFGPAEGDSSSYGMPKQRMARAQQVIAKYHRHG